MIHIPNIRALQKRFSKDWWRQTDKRTDKVSKYVRHFILWRYFLLSREICKNYNKIFKFSKNSKLHKKRYILWKVQIATLIWRKKNICRKVVNVKLWYLEEARELNSGKLKKDNNFKLIKKRFTEFGNVFDVFTKFLLKKFISLLKILSSSYM